MNLETKKKNLIGIWMLTHQNLNRILREEFLNHPITQEILKYEIKFAYYAIERKKKALLSEILEIVLEVEKERVAMLGAIEKQEVENLAQPIKLIQKPKPEQIQRAA